MSGMFFLFLRSSSGETKFDGSIVQNENITVPTIITGINVDVNEIDASRYLYFSLQYPGSNVSPLLEQTNRIRKNRDQIITSLSTCLLPYIPKIRENIKHLSSCNRIKSIHNILLAIGRVFLNDALLKDL
jgi:hypothetical protein